MLKPLIQAQVNENLILQGRCLTKVQKFYNLTEKFHDTAWQKAVSNSEVDLLDVAKCGGAGNDMIEYIKESRENRLAAFE